jgi:hypothetical protein
LVCALSASCIPEIMELRHTMLDERCLDLSSRQSVAGDVDNIIDTSPDPVVTFVITPSAVSSELRRLVDITTTRRRLLT